MILLFYFLAGWHIVSYQDTVELSKQGTAYVIEHITVDFGKEPHHGIYRYMLLSQGPFPVTGLKMPNFKLLKVSMDGHKVPYMFKNSMGYMYLRIGNPGKLITGKHNYRIAYILRDAVKHEKDRDIFNFNVIGPEWKVNIEEFGAILYLPEDIYPERILAFVGQKGSMEHKKVNIENYGSIIEFTGLNSLSPFEAFTIYLKFPQGSFESPGILEKLFLWLKYNWIALLPLLVLIFLSGLWYTHGRDPVNHSGIVVRYHPPEGLNPPELGTLYDEKVDGRDIVALIIDLARRGYLKIVESRKKVLFMTKSDYEFVKTDKEWDDLKAYEVLLLSSIFTGGLNRVKLSSLKKNFYKFLPGLKRLIYRSLKEKGYFPMSPESVRKTYKNIGISIMFLSFFLGMWKGLFFSFSFLLSGLIFILFAPYMPRKTRKGARKHREILGFKEFLTRVEKDRIKKLAENVKGYFEEVLPFAIALGLEEKWLRAFSGLLKDAPEWFVSSSGQFSNFAIFHTSFVHSVDSMVSSTNFSPRGHGTGSFGSGAGAGGGVGGGGGGAW